MSWHFICTSIRPFMISGRGGAIARACRWHRAAPGVTTTDRVHTLLSRHVVKIKFLTMRKPDCCAASYSVFCPTRPAAVSTSCEQTELALPYQGASLSSDSKKALCRALSDGRHGRARALAADDLEIFEALPEKHALHFPVHAMESISVPGEATSKAPCKKQIRPAISWIR